MRKHPFIIHSVLGKGVGEPVDISPVMMMMEMGAMQRGSGEAHLEFDAAAAARTFSLSASHL